MVLNLTRSHNLKILVICSNIKIYQPSYLKKKKKNLKYRFNTNDYIDIIKNVYEKGKNFKDITYDGKICITYKNISN